MTRARKSCGRARSPITDLPAAARRPTLRRTCSVNVRGAEAGADDEQTALAGIRAMEEFFRSIGMPTSIAELEGFELTDEQIDTLARACVSRSASGTIGAFQPLGLEDVRAIYTAAR